MALILKKNIRTIYWMFFLHSFMIVIAVFVPLLQRHGLSMAQVLQTQALFAFVVAVFEVPSGYLADLWGRRNTIVTGLGLITLGYLTLVFADSFVDFLVYEAFMGLGISLASGADLALLYDTQAALNAEGQQGPAPGKHISRLVALEGYGGAASGLAASFLTLLGLDWVLWAQFACGLLALVCALQLTEAPRLISTDGHAQNVRRVLHTMTRQPMILWTSLAIVVFGLLGLYAFWVYQKYWEFNGVPLTWFGYLWAVHCVLRGVAGHWATEVEEALGWRKLFVLCALLPIIGLLGMGLLGGWAGIACSLGLVVSRGLCTVVFYDALNKRVGSDFRSTINSLVSLGTRSLFIVTGPILGYAVDHQGVRATLLMLAMLMLPLVVLVLLRLGRYIDGESRQVALPAPEQASAGQG